MISHFSEQIEHLQQQRDPYLNVVNAMENTYIEAPWKCSIKALNEEESTSRLGEGWRC